MLITSGVKCFSNGFEHYWITVVDQGEGPGPPPLLWVKKEKNHRGQKSWQGKQQKTGLLPPRSGSTTELSDDMKENLDTISPL